MRKITYLVLFVGSLFLLFGCATTDDLERLSAYEPSPELSPEEVVRIQMEAFRNNDEEDRGIAVAFRFASPNNRRNTGPVERFSRMMQGPLYRPMLMYEDIRYGEAAVRGRVALQRVELTLGERRFTYDFYLVRQDGGEYDQCWMTEGVSIVPNQERSDTFNV